MLANIYKKILSMADFKDIDKIIDNIDDIILKFNPTKYDIEQGTFVQSEEEKVVDNNKILEKLYISQNFNNLTKYFEVIEKYSEIPQGNGTVVLETEEQYKQRMIDIVPIKKIFLRIFKKANHYKGTKDYIEFVLFFYNKMKYFPNNDELNVATVEEVGAFRYFVVGTASENEYESIIKPIVHPIGWKYYYSDVNQKYRNNFVQPKSNFIKAKLDFCSIGYSKKKHFKRILTVGACGNIQMDSFTRNYNSTMTNGYIWGETSRKIKPFLDEEKFVNLENPILSVEEFGTFTTNWITNTNYKVGDFVTSTSNNNFVYECIESLTLSSNEPNWIEIIGAETVDENDNKWICRKNDLLEIKIIKVLTGASIRYEKSADSIPDNPTISSNAFPIFESVFINKNDVLKAKNFKEINGIDYESNISVIKYT